MAEAIDHGPPETRSTWPTAPIRALLLDVDGTLYRPRPVRLRMGAELALLPLAAGSPASAVSVWRIVAAFRRLREGLRDRPADGEPLERAQLEAAASATGRPVEEVAAVVEEWILRRPLRHLAAAVAPDASAVLDRAAAAGAAIGFLSDYPVVDKVRALGLERHLGGGVALCTTDPAIDAFKPDPRGFELAAERFGLPPAEVLYVGDRPAVDAAGAARAGMPCAILAPSGSRRAADAARYPGTRAVDGFAALWAAVGARIARAGGDGR